MSQDLSDLYKLSEWLQRIHPGAAWAHSSIDRAISRLEQIESESRQQKQAQTTPHALPAHATLGDFWEEQRNSRSR